MRCLVLTITRNRRGQPIREGRIVSGEVLTIGRGSDCAIFLPHARVNLHHATLRTQDDGRLVIEAQNSQISINGTPAQRARLRPDTRITIGPYTLVVELAGAEGYPEHDFALTLELLDAPIDPRAAKKRPAMTLAQAGLSKRLPALFLAFLIGALFLAFPVLHATQPEFRATVKEALPVLLAADESWSPGALAAGHRGFGRDCRSCHVLPFEHVRDRECVSCHEATGTHIQDAALQRAAFGATRCAECHRDHRGLASMNDIDPALCVECHGSFRARGFKTSLPEISDFKTAHPPFKLSIATGPLPKDVVRIARTDRANLKQNTGLKFPHDVHLAKIGVESHAAPPGQKGRVVLHCADCHVAEESGVGFRPISMEKHCADCHRLEFEPDVTTRQVPHGSEKNVLLMLREFYASEALGTTPLEVTTVDGLLRRPGTHAMDVRQREAIDWANEKTRRVAADLFEVRVCVVCHTVIRQDTPTLSEVALPGAEPPLIAVPWKVQPVFLTQRWMPKARFEHAKHAAVDCVDCHAVTLSKSSADVSMPEIGKCRECHVGSQPERNKIASNCELCHGFHRHEPPVAGHPGGGTVTAQGAPLATPALVPENP
jgi:hypothetical protein